MPSTTLLELLGAYNVREWGIIPDSGDIAPKLNEAMAYVAGQANPILFVPPGTYWAYSTISIPSNIALEGFGSLTIFKLYGSQLVDVMKADGVSNIRLRNFRIDGNRANNTGNRYGLWMNGVVDAWLENIEAVSARGDGFRLDSCSRVVLNGCKASDNGRHGFSLSYSEYCQLMAPRAYDNCQVSLAGVGDGINLELLSHDNTIVAPMCYETSLAGDYHGYGVREQAGEGCNRNTVTGGSFQGNRTGTISMESIDSPAFTPSSVRYDDAILTTV